MEYDESFPLMAVFAAVPPMINYQGKLLKADGTAVADGTYSMVFAIYDIPPVA